MLGLLIQWLLSAAALLVVSHFVHGFHIHGIVPALIASVVIGLLNATLGRLIKLVTLPLSIFTLGLFLLVINAIVLWVASWIVPGFSITSPLAPLVAAVVLAVLGMVIRTVTR
jgi:putative membrane protein